MSLLTGKSRCYKCIKVSAWGRQAVVTRWLCVSQRGWGEQLAHLFPRVTVGTTPSFHTATQIRINRFLRDIVLFHDHHPLASFQPICVHSGHLHNCNEQILEILSLCFCTLIITIVSLQNKGHSSDCYAASYISTWLLKRCHRQSRYSYTVTSRCEMLTQTRVPSWSRFCVRGCLCLLKFMRMCEDISVSIIYEVTLCMLACVSVQLFACVCLLWYDNAPTFDIGGARVCVRVCLCVRLCALEAAQAGPPGGRECVSLSENNKFVQGGEKRGCDHQSIPLLFLKLGGRDECERQEEEKVR